MDYPTFSKLPAPQKLETLENYRIQPPTNPLEEQQLRLLLRAVASSECETTYIRSEAIAILSRFAIYGIIEWTESLVCLKDSIHWNNTAITSKSLKYLYFFCLNDREAIFQIFSDFANDPDPDLASESNLALAKVLIFFSEPAKLPENLDRAKYLLQESISIRENRRDSQVYLSLVEFILSSIKKEPFDPRSQFKTYLTHLWQHVAMLQDEEPLDQAILWELYKTVRNILLVLESDSEAALNLESEFNKLFSCHLEIQLSELGNHIKGQTFTFNVTSGILPPILLVKLQSTAKAIKTYLSTISESSAEYAFYTTLLDSTASPEDTTKACIDLARLFPNADTDKITKMIKGSPDTRLAAFEIIQNLRSENFFPSLITACAELQANPKVVNTDEDSRNAFIHTQLKAGGFNSKDQGRQGISSTGKSPGELDIKIEDHRGIRAIIECFDLTSKETDKISLHIKKLFGYDPNGLDRNFVIVYSEAKGFVQLWEAYREYIPLIDCGYVFIGFEDISQLSSRYSGIKLGAARYSRNGQPTEVIHIFIDMSIKDPAIKG